MAGRARWPTRLPTDDPCVKPMLRRDSPREAQEAYLASLRIDRTPLPRVSAVSTSGPEHSAAKDTDFHPVLLPTPGLLARGRQAPPRSLYCCDRRTERYRVRQVTIACAISLRRCVRCVWYRTRTTDIYTDCCSRDHGTVCQLASQDVELRQSQWCASV